MKKIDNLLSIREHLKDAKDGYRKKLAEMWENGIRSGWLFDKLNNRMELTESKLDKINDTIFQIEDKKVNKRELRSWNEMIGRYGSAIIE